jgi:hypothetical protein
MDGRRCSAAHTCATSPPWPAMPRHAHCVEPAINLLPLYPAGHVCDVFVEMPSCYNKHLDEPPTPPCCPLLPLAFLPCSSPARPDVAAQLVTKLQPLVQIQEHVPNVFDKMPGHTASPLVSHVVLCCDARVSSPA